MTDNEIMKALECCGIDDCRDCPCYSEDLGCDQNLELLALDLINRQKEKILKLETEIEKSFEFIQSYAFEDKKEIYTNGAILVPLFRVKQALIDKAYEGFRVGNRSK